MVLFLFFLDNLPMQYLHPTQVVLFGERGEQEADEKLSIFTHTYIFHTRLAVCLLMFYYDCKNAHTQHKEHSLHRRGMYADFSNTKGGIVRERIDFRFKGGGSAHEDVCVLVWLKEGRQTRSR